MLLSAIYLLLLLPGGEGGAVLQAPCPHGAPGCDEAVQPHTQLLLLLLSTLLFSQVVKEVLRYRPPAPMVPQVAMKPFNLTASYTAPKGAFIIPDIISACRQGYIDPDKFDPDRFR
jgi:cytochrome P450